MDNQILVKETLTDEMIKEGYLLVSALVRSGLPFSAAYWLFNPEQNDWRLIIATKEVETKGPKAVYGKIEQALGKVPVRRVGLTDVAVVSSNDELSNLLSKAVHLGGISQGMRFSRNSVSGRYIQDALIYKS